MAPVEGGEASSGPAREIPPIPILHPTNPPGNHFDIWPRKLELPMFDSDNLEGWILKAERFFALNRLTATKKVEASVICFKGDALLWYQYEQKRKPILQWEEMQVLLWNRFRPAIEGITCQKFLSLRQTGTMAKFRREFELLAAPLDHSVSLEVMESTFVNGLTEEIRAELRLWDVLDLDKKWA